VCVAGSRTGRILEAPSPHPARFINHYERTKWEAEQLALEAAERGLPVQIARVSVVMGAHADGYVHRLGALHHILRWFGRGLVPLMPGTGQSAVDLIPAETAARYIARAVLEPQPAGAIWHIAAGGRSTPLARMMRFVWEQFGSQPGLRPPGMPEPRLVDPADFERFRHAATHGGDAVLGHLLESLDSFLPGLLYPKVLDTTAAEAMWGGPLPLPDWRETLQRVIRFACLRPARAESRPRRRRAAPAVA
jgi:nucleoside-diphosphate-sugar epimerase